MQKTGLYYHVPGGVIAEGPRGLPLFWKAADRTIPGFNHLLDESLKEHDWLPEYNNKDSAIADDKVWDEPPTQDIQTNKVALTYSQRDKTTNEVQAEDESALRSETLKLARVTVSLVKYLLGHPTLGMSNTDFPAGVRQDFLDIKVIADRIED